VTERAKQLREVARQALYSTPNDQECEVHIIVDTLRELVNQCAYTHLEEIQRTNLPLCRVRTLPKLSTDLTTVPVDAL